MWIALGERETEQIDRTAGAVAFGLAGEVGSRMRSAVDRLRSLADFWERVGRQPQEEWRFSAELFIAGQPGVQRIAWQVPGLLGQRWTARAESAQRPEQPDVLQSARATALETAVDTGREAVVGPFPLAGGGRGLELVLPVGAPEEGLGALVAQVRFDQIMHAAVERHDPAFSVQIVADGTSAFLRGPAIAPDARALRTFSLELPGETTWMLHIAPTQEWLSAQATPLPGVVLVSGLLGSLLLAGLLHESRLSARRAAELARLNRELSQEAVERLEAEREVRALNRELERRVEARTHELNEAIDDLEAYTYSVSHDLRSPLGAIANFATILREDYAGELDADGTDCVERIGSSAHSALGMMDALLSFSGMGRGKLRWADLTMTDLFRDVFEELCAAREQRPLLELGELPRGRGDADMVRIVVQNLLSNALKFSAHEKHARIQVSGARESGEAVYEVCDNGLGFDPRYGERLFRVFERLHPEEGYEGYGVGLATAARIVRRHGGRIGAEGRPGEGARFWFTLPGPAE